MTMIVMIGFSHTLFRPQTSAHAECYRSRGPCEAWTLSARSPVPTSSLAPCTAALFAGPVSSFSSCALHSARSQHRNLGPPPWGSSLVVDFFTRTARACSCQQHRRRRQRGERVGDMGEARRVPSTGRCGRDRSEHRGRAWAGGVPQAPRWTREAGGEGRGGSPGASKGADGRSEMKC